MTDRQAFEAELFRIVTRAQKQNRPHVEVNSGELHRAVGGYPTPTPRMPMCCNVMRKEMIGGDEFVFQPPKGDGASLTIRYQLPR